MIPTSAELSTPRLRLQPVRSSDEAIYLAYFQDAEASKWNGGPLEDIDACRDRLMADVSHWTRRGHGMWMLRRRSDDLAVGACGLVWSEGWPRSELTWWLLSEHRGCGYAKEASLAAIQYGYETLGWPLVETHTRDENAPARRLVARLGGYKIAREPFPDGVSRDVFALPHPMNLSHKEAV
ncbi:MAG: GNAT family N-acetyltransferase [Rhodobacteraceae bacterium]|nr:GNAT family N-acetyltransferase [Paracoccaceae bacterium]